MFNAKTLLDALVSASARPGGLAGAIGGVINQATSGLQDATQKAGQAPSVGQKVDQTIGQVASGVASGQGPSDLMAKAKQVMADNPGLAEAAAIGLAGLLFGSRRSRGVQPSLAQLGGLALVGGLAYKAYENYRSGKPLIDMGAQPAGARAQGGAIGPSAGGGGQQAGSGAGGGTSGPSGGGAGGGQSAGAGAQGGMNRGASQDRGGMGADASAGSRGGIGGQGSAGMGSAGMGSSGMGSGRPGAGASSGSSGGQASGATPGQGPSQSDVAHSLRSLGVPEASGFHPVSQTEDDALLYLRAMVAAASADGQIDEAERSRIAKGLIQAGIDAEATRWLEREMAAPADVEELAAQVTSPEKAAQIYTAARIAIDPDTIQEREFLRQLAESLDLDETLKAQIDSTATAIKMG